MPGVATFLIGLVLGAVGTVFFLLWRMVPVLERLYIFRPMRDVFRTPDELGIDYDQCFIDTPDGCRLSAWHLCPPDPLGSVVYFHGNSGNLGLLNEILALLYRNGLQVLAVDYRGYGWSTGHPSEEGLYRDSVATIEYFRANFDRDGRPLIYWGRSLGCCVAAYAAGHSAPEGLILESGFPSKQSLLGSFRRFRAVLPFTRCRFDTLEHLRGHQFPVLLVHGDRDRTIPFKHGEELFRALDGPKEFHRVVDAGHLDTHMKDTGSYMKRILKFVQDIRPPVVH